HCLMHIEAAAPLDHHVHVHLPCNEVVAAPQGKSDTAMRAHPGWGRQNVIPSRRAGRSLRRGVSPQGGVDLKRPPPAFCHRTGPRAYAFPAFSSTVVRGPVALVASLRACERTAIEMENRQFFPRPISPPLRVCKLYQSLINGIPSRDAERWTPASAGE